MFKKLTILLFVLVLTMSMVLSGCSKTSEKLTEPEVPAVEESDDTIKVAMIFTHLGDLGFNDEGYNGLEMAEKELGVEFDYVETPEVADAETQIRMFASTEEYDLILALGATYQDAITFVAVDYPEQRFSLIDTAAEGHGLDNVHGVAARDPEQTFLSGVIAGLVTLDDRMEKSNDDNVIGFVGGMDSPASRAGAAGFLSGAKFVNQNVDLIYTIAGSYRDPGKGKEIALTAYERGADIMSHNAGGTGLGVFDAAKELNKYAIGSSLATVDVDTTLVTSIKKTDLFVFQEIEAIQNGTWEAGSTRKGLKEGVCDYNVEGLNSKLPADIIEKTNKIKQLVIDGVIKLPSDPAEIEEWSKTNFYTE